MILQDGDTVVKNANFFATLFIQWHHLAVEPFVQNEGKKGKSGAHDPGLETVGSLLLVLLLLLKPTSFFKAHVSPKDLKLGMEPKMVMKKG